MKENDMTIAIPTLDSMNPLTRTISGLTNVMHLTQTTFHQTLLDTWEALGNPGVFQIHFPFGPIVFVADPLLAERVVRDTGKIRHSPDEPAQYGDFEKSRLTRGLGGKDGPTGMFGILAMSNTEIYGQLTYREIQQYLLPAFSKQALTRYSAIMVLEADIWVRNLPLTYEFDLAPRLSTLNLNTITQTMMSIRWQNQLDITRLSQFLRNGSQNATTRALIQNKSILAVLEMASHILPQFIVSHRQYLKEREWLYENMVSHILMQHMSDIKQASAKGESFKSRDMVDFLISALLEAQSSDPRYTDDTLAEIIKSQIVTFLMAGQETTTSVEISVFRYILDPNNQAVYEKIKHEISSAIGKRLPTYDDIKTLPYLSAVVNYVMTMYPPAFIIPRETLHSVQLGEYVIPGQTQVFPIPLLMHRMLIPELESKGPELFLDPAINDTFFQKIITFGKGKRACIGEQFARVAQIMHLATILQFADVTLISADVGTSGLIPYRAAGQLRVRLTQREHYSHSQDG